MDITRPPLASQSSKETLIYDLSTAALSSIPLTALKVTVESAQSKTARAGTYVVHVDASTLSWLFTNQGTSTTKVAVLVVGLSSKDKI
jgi:hypothetical protein